MFNHVIDPTYFWDAIEEFSFDYTIYVLIDKDTVDDYGHRVCTYSKNTIRGSLQSLGTKVRQSKDGNTKEVEFNFFCKSIYRINEGDVIYYNNNYLRCDSLLDNYDEMGVRGAHLTMVKLSDYKDLKDYINYLQGSKIV